MLVSGGEGGGYLECYLTLNDVNNKFDKIEVYCDVPCTEYTNGGSGGNSFMGIPATSTQAQQAPCDTAYSTLTNGSGFGAGVSCKAYSQFVETAGISGPGVVIITKYLL